MLTVLGISDVVQVVAVAGQVTRRGAVVAVAVIK